MVDLRPFAEHVKAGRRPLLYESILVSQTEDELCIKSKYTLFPAGRLRRFLTSPWTADR